MNWLDQRSYDKAILSEGVENINQRQHQYRFLLSQKSDFVLDEMTCCFFIKNIRMKFGK